MSASVLIVGAGPSGLVLALSLLQNGVSVRIIEKEVSHRVGERGAAVMPRTLEAHNLLGILPDVLAITKLFFPLRMYTPGSKKHLVDREMSPYVDPSPQVPYSNPVALGQNYQEAILRSHIKKFGVEVELGTKLESFEQFDDHVVAHLVKTIGDQPVTESTKVSWLVGTDGAQSVVRKQLNLSFLGQTYEQQPIAIGDIHTKGLDQSFWHMYSDENIPLVSFRPSGQDTDVFNFAVVLAADDKRDLVAAGRDEFVSFLNDITGNPDINFGDLIWKGTYRANVRMVDRFHKGRVFVAGDAAHCHSPTGGQGMNSSVQDAFNLGWKLALVIRGLAPITLVDTYDEERLPVIKEMLDMTTILLQKTIKPKDQNDRDTAMQRGRELHMLGVNYRNSSIVLDDGILERGIGAAYGVDSEFAARAGDRAPDAPGLTMVPPTNEKLSLFQLFQASCHTVLAFGGTAEQHEQLASSVAKLPKGLAKTILILADNVDAPNTAEVFDVVVEDSEGHAYRGYHLGNDETKFVVVRPDGVVGARVSTVDNVQKYFSMIFI